MGVCVSAHRPPPNTRIIGRNYRFEDDDEPKGKLHEKAAAFRAMLEGDPSDSIKEFAEELNALPQGASNETKQLVLERLGNCTWSNVLYHEPGETGA